MFLRKVVFMLSALFFVFVFIGSVDQEQAAAKKQKSKELEIIMASYIPPQAYKDLTPMVMSFPDYVNEHGKGIAHIEYYHSGKLLKAKQLLPGLMQGTADIVLHTSSYISSTYPILGILELPFLYTDMEKGWEKLTVGSPLFNLINEELAKKNIYMISTIPPIPEYIWTKDRPMKKPDDIKGLRIRTAGRIEGKMIQAIGGASTTMPSAELYEGIARGTIDGVMCYLGTILARGLHEKLGYVTTGYFASYGGPILIRLDKWKSLPPDVRELLSAAGKHYEKQIPEYAQQYWEKNIWPSLRKAGIKEVKLTNKEIEAFQEKAKPIWDWWKEQLPPGVGEKAIRLATE